MSRFYGILINRAWETTFYFFTQIPDFENL